MWQLTFELHDLVQLHGLINGQKVIIMFDNSAVYNFLNYRPKFVLIITTSPWL